MCGYHFAQARCVSSTICMLGTSAGEESQSGACGSIEEACKASSAFRVQDLQMLMHGPTHRPTLYIRSVSGWMQYGRMLSSPMIVLVRLSFQPCERCDAHSGTELSC